MTVWETLNRFDNGSFEHAKEKQRKQDSERDDKVGFSTHKKKSINIIKTYSNFITRQEKLVKKY